MANPFFNFNAPPAGGVRKAPKIDFSKFGLQNSPAKPEPKEPEPVAEPEPEVLTAVQEPEEEVLEELEPIDAASDLFMLTEDDNASEAVGQDLSPTVIDPADESTIEDPAIEVAEREQKETEAPKVVDSKPEAVPATKTASKNKLQASETEVVKPTKKVTRRKKVEPKVEEVKVEEPKVEEPVNQTETTETATEASEQKSEPETVEIVKEGVPTVVDISVLLESKYTPDEMIEKVMSKFSDPTFEKFKSDVAKRLGKIKITEDMPPGAIRYLLHDLDNLSGDLFLLRTDTRTMYHALTEKIGIFAAHVALNTPGKSVTEKERNRSLAYLDVNFYNENVNFLPVMEAVRHRKIFLEEVEAYMDEKRHAIYSALANNKIEAEVAKLSD